MTHVTAVRRVARAATSLTAAGALAGSLLLAVGAGAPAVAGPGKGHHGPGQHGKGQHGKGQHGPAQPGATQTRHLDLPDGFAPEGIAIGEGPGRGKGHGRGGDHGQGRGHEKGANVAYLGSRTDGDILRLNLRSGQTRVITQGPGTPSLGMKVDARGRLFVAGGTGGDARVVDTRTGRVLASYDLVEGDAFINDVVLTDRAAWFTDSASAQLFVLPLGRDGALPAPGAVRRVPLTGEWQQLAGTNANGITTTPDHRALLVVNSANGTLYRVTANGRARVVDLGGASLTNGDGLLREGRTLYAVQNRLNQIAQVRLSASGDQGEVERTITDDDFDVPTTVARSGERLYLPNARFSTPATPETAYWVTGVAVPRH